MWRSRNAMRKRWRQKINSESIQDFETEDLPIEIPRAQSPPYTPHLDGLSLLCASTPVPVMQTEEMPCSSFPLKVEFHEKFVAAIPPSLRPKVSKYSKICSRHFTTDCFQPITSTSVWHILKRHAIPTLFDYHLDCTPTNEALNYGPSTSNINVVFDEEKPPNDNSSQSTMVQCSNIGKKDVSVQTMEQCSSIDKKDVGVQLTDKCLPPTQTVTTIAA